MTRRLLTQGVAEGDARSELIKLAVRKIVEETLEAEVAEAVGRGYYESGAVPGCSRHIGLPSSLAGFQWFGDRGNAVRVKCISQDAARSPDLIKNGTPGQPLGQES